MNFSKYSYLIFLFLGLTVVVLLVTHDFLTTIYNISLYYNQIVYELNRNGGYGIKPFRMPFFGRNIDAGLIRWYYDFMILIIIILIGLMIFIDLYWKKKTLKSPSSDQKTNSFLNSIVVLIAHHDQFVDLLNNNHGYGSPYYTTFFFNKGVGLNFVKLLQLIITVIQTIVISLIVFFIIIYCRRYYIFLHPPNDKVFESFRDKTILPKERIK